MAKTVPVTTATAKPRSPHNNTDWLTQKTARNPTTATAQIMIHAMKSLRHSRITKMVPTRNRTRVISLMRLS